MLAPLNDSNYIYYLPSHMSLNTVTSIRANGLYMGALLPIKI